MSPVGTTAGGRGCWRWYEWPSLVLAMTDIQTGLQPSLVDTPEPPSPLEAHSAVDVVLPTATSLRMFPQHNRFQDVSAKPCPRCHHQKASQRIHVQVS